MSLANANTSSAWRLFSPGVLGAVCLLVGCVPLEREEAPLSAAVPAPGGADRSGPSGSVSGCWWEVFDDAALDRLMTQLGCGNLQLRQIEASLAAERWGGVYRAVRAEEARIETAAQCEGLRLALQSQVAQSYFRLCYLDEEDRILEQAMRGRDENLELARARRETGLSSDFDVAAAEADMAVIRAGRARLAGPREKLENAIAAILGQDPACFSIEPEPLRHRLPRVSRSIPFCVLENRPDVAAAADRFRLAAARGDQGVPKLFPQTDLIGPEETGRTRCTQFLDWSNKMLCATDPTMSRHRSAVRKKALLDFQAVVLRALREIDDALTGLDALRAEEEAQLLSIDAADRTVQMAKVQNEEGVISAASLAEVERELLAAQRRLVQIRGEELVETVRLIEALGGGAPACRLFASS